MIYKSDLLMNTKADTRSVRDAIGGVIDVQSRDPNGPYRSPINFRPSRNIGDLDFDGDMRSYLKALGTDASGAMFYLRKGAKKGDSVFTAEIDASKSGEIGNGEYARYVGNQLWQLLDFSAMSIRN